MIFAQEVPVFLATPWAGWLADRLDRRRLMIACDLARTVICASFLLVGPDNLWLAYVLLATLSIFAAVFDPASSAALPNVVDPEDLPTANALSGSLWGTMLAVGAAARRRRRHAVRSATQRSWSTRRRSRSPRCCCSACTEPFPSPASTTSTSGSPRPPARPCATPDRIARVWALVSVKFGFGAAAGVLALIAVFAKELFHAGDVGFGLLMAARGVGALIGPFVGHRLAGPGHRRLLPVIACSLATFGIGYALLGVDARRSGWRPSRSSSRTWAAARSGCCRATGCSGSSPTTSAAGSSPSTSP